MSKGLTPGETLPDFQLPDHTGTIRRLSELQAGEPMVVLLGRGHHCPRENQHQRAMVQFYEWCAVAYTQLVTISTADVHELNTMRRAVGARWTFLSDAQRVVQRTLDIQEYTDPVHDPLVPHTLVLAPGLLIDKVHVGYWFWGRPSPYQLWEDLQDLFRRIKADYDPTVPELRAAWQEQH